MKKIFLAMLLTPALLLGCPDMEFFENHPEAEKYHVDFYIDFDDDEDIFLWHEGHFWRVVMMKHHEDCGCEGFSD